MGARTDGENCLGHANLLLRSSEEPQLARWCAPPQLAAKGLLHPAQWDTLRIPTGCPIVGRMAPQVFVNVIATKRPDKFYLVLSRNMLIVPVRFSDCGIPYSPSFWEVVTQRLWP